MKVHNQRISDMPRWRGGRRVGQGAARPWRPALDHGLGTADDRLWCQAEASALDWFDDDSWISRARSL